MNIRDKIETILGLDYETIETKEFKKFYTRDLEVLYAPKNPRVVTVFDRRNRENVLVFNNLDAALKHFQHSPSSR